MTPSDSLNSPLNQRDELGRTPLVSAIMLSDEKFITMLEAGADPNQYSTVSYHGQFDTCWAARHQACENLNLVAITPVHAAIIRGREDFLKAAMSAGGSPDLPALGTTYSPDKNDSFYSFINHHKRKYGDSDAFIEIEPLDSHQEWLENIFRPYCHNLKLPFTHDINEWIRFMIRLCEDRSLANSYPEYIIHITSVDILQVLSTNT